MHTCNDEIHFIYFLKQNGYCINEKVHNLCICKKTDRGDNTTAPYKEPNQSKKSIKEVMLSHMYTVTQSQYKYKKELLKN